MITLVLISVTNVPFLSVVPSYSFCPYEDPFLYKRAPILAAVIEDNDMNTCFTTSIFSVKITITTNRSTKVQVSLHGNNMVSPIHSATIYSKDHYNDTVEQCILIPSQNKFSVVFICTCVCKCQSINIVMNELNFIICEVDIQVIQFW